MGGIMTTSKQMKESFEYHLGMRRVKTPPHVLRQVWLFLRDLALVTAFIAAAVYIGMTFIPRMAVW